MGRNHYFQFKQFHIRQEKAAMKVGIDGVLLGAWANFGGCGRILDIGAGTGLIALMAAQRSFAQIDAVEIEPEAADEANHNFSHSKWADRLTLYKCPFQDFEPERSYDHLVSNPPFFENSLKAKDLKRSTARHTDSMSLHDLLHKAISIMTDDGKISLILPSDTEGRLRSLIPKLGLFMSRFAYVSSKQTKKPHRFLVELASCPISCEKGTIFLRDVDTNEFSDEFRKLTRDFYLNY